MEQISIRQHKSLRESVYDNLKMQILKGIITPGTRMMEVELAEQLGVSRTPIREAIKMLEKEGLVTVESRKGAYVSQFSKLEIIHVLEVRENLDGLAAFYAAQRASEASIERMVKLAEAYAEAVESNNTTDIIKNDEAFHMAIVEATGNKALIGMVRELQELVKRFRYIYYDNYKVVEAMVTEHQRIIDEIISKRADNARKAAELHVDGLKHVVEQAKAK